MRWERRLSVYIALAVAFAASLPFVPSLGSDFLTYWDDSQNLTSNLAYRGLDFSHLRWMFTTFYGGPYQPLTWLSFGLDYSLWGMNPVGYHLTNLLLHALNAALFYFVAENVVKLALGTRSDWRLRAASAAAALLFAVHPLRVEAVAFATERRTVLAALFYLGAILLYLRGRSISTIPANSRDSMGLWAVAGLFALSLLSKGIGLALPATLLALDYYPLKRKLGLDLLIEKIPLVIVAGAFAAIELLGYSTAGHLLALSQVPLTTRLAQAAFGLGFYVCKTLIPAGLSPVYRAPRTAVVVLSALLVVETTALLLWARRRTPAALVAWLHYGLTLLPVLGLFQVSSQTAADRYTYLPCLGFALLAAGALARLQKPRRFASGLALAAGIIVVLGAASWRQTLCWKDSEALWRRAVEVDPNNVDALNNLGVTLEATGKRAEAVDCYERAARADPHALFPPLNLGAVYLKSGRLDESIEQYQRALWLDPRNIQAHTNLGVALKQKGLTSQANYQFAIVSALKESR